MQAGAGAYAMPITTTMLSRVLTVAASALPDSVVTVGHTYTDGGGTHSQTFEAIRGGLSQTQRVTMAGAAALEGFNLVVNLATQTIITPAAGDRITVRKGDGADTTYTVMAVNRDPTTEAMMTLTVGPQYG